jgi:hypothetical protein
VKYYQALDTFVAGLQDSGEVLVTRGAPLPETHELVQRDLAACKADPGRAPLFRPLGEDEPPAAPKARRGGRGLA